MYQRIDQLLGEAIEAFNQPYPGASIKFSGGDIIYEGDLQNWIRFAWSLKARYLNHLSKKDKLYDPQPIAILSENILLNMLSVTMNTGSLKIIPFGKTKIRGTGPKRPIREFPS